MQNQEKKTQTEFKIAVLPGDGIGPEVTAEAVKVLQLVAKRLGIQLTMHEYLVGGAAIDAAGTALPAETEAGCLASDAILFGAVGGPKWDHLPREQSAEQGLLRLRRLLSVYANLRPVRLRREHPVRTPLRPEVLGDGVDIIIVRELTGGLYYGKRGRESSPEGVSAFDTLTYSEAEIERIVRLAFELAATRGRRLASVDKANVLETGRLWREVAQRLAAEYPDIALEHVYVDNFAMQLVRAPRQYDVIVTENTFGDILSDLGGALVGSLGVLPSASLGEAGKPGLYEPIHGSAPDIAGRGIANPLGAIGSAAMLLKYSLGLTEAATVVENAVDQVLRDGPWTPDIVPDGVQPASTQEVGDAVCSIIEAKLER